MNGNKIITSRRLYHYRVVLMYIRDTTGPCARGVCVSPRMRSSVEIKQSSNPSIQHPKTSITSKNIQKEQVETGALERKRKPVRRKKTCEEEGDL